MTQDLAITRFTLRNVADRTDSARVAAESFVTATRQAQVAACDEGGPMEVLLREALAEAVVLKDRITMLARFAADAARREA